MTTVTILGRAKKDFDLMCTEISKTTGQTLFGQTLNLDLTSFGKKYVRTDSIFCRFPEARAEFMKIYDEAAKKSGTQTEAAELLRLEAFGDKYLVTRIKDKRLREALRNDKKEDLDVDLSPCG